MNINLPQEKAEELIRNFMSILTYCIIDMKDKEKLLLQGIQCAMTTVDEILNLDKQDIYMDYTFWRNVKKELEKTLKNENRR